MAKAILELEMPESCRECEFINMGICILLSRRYQKIGDRIKAHAYGVPIGRRQDCPLKLVEKER